MKNSFLYKYKVIQLNRFIHSFKIMGPNYEGGRFQLSIINGNNLEQSLFECAEKSPAVLVRGHGLFVWGASWSQTIDRCEAIEALFEVHIKMFNHGRQPGQNMP